MVLGFTRKLLSWWNHYLTEESKEEIKSAVQKDEEGCPIFDETIGRGVPDGVNTLIYTITSHFIGTPSNVTTRIHDQLSNLRCPTLSDYRWYVNVFTIRVMHRNDCNSSFWKEKFINGLPSLFAHKIRETLRNSLGIIEYDDLTYGDISSVIRREGLKMCIDMKIQNQANKDKRKAKYEVGNFCTQYGLPFIALSKRKSREKEYPRKRTASRYYRSHKKPSNFNRNDFYKKNKKSRDYHKANSKKKNPTQKTFDKKNSECYKCGKKVNFKNECRSKVKDLINNLQGDQTSKDEIFKLLELNHTDSESFNSSNDNEIFEINQSSSSRESSNISSSPDIIIGYKDSCCKNKSNNVLTQPEYLLLTLIDKVEDPVIKAQYLSKFQSTLVKETKETKSKHPEPSVNLEKIFNRFTKVKKEVTVNDLQHKK